METASAIAGMTGKTASLQDDETQADFEGSYSVAGADEFEEVAGHDMVSSEA